MEVYQVVPATDSAVPATELSLPLTFFDGIYFRFPPAERIYLYKLTASSPEIFRSEIVPTLKRSLSLTLRHFSPLAGNLTWPPDSPSPIILYSTKDDAVSLTVAESNADFDRLTDGEIRDVAELRPYIPELLISDTMASPIALQITLFPKKGFSIGIAMNHAVLDGRSASMFLKAWAHICRNIKNGQSIPLSQEVTPSFDRSIIKDPDELAPFYLNQWQFLSDTNPRTMKLLSNLPGDANYNLVRATYLLSREKLDKLKQNILSYHKQGTKNLHLSTLVTTCACICVCLVKARGGDSNRKVYFIIPVDCRNRLDLDPPIPGNYFGNCIYVLDVVEKAGTFFEENGVAVIAKKLSDAIQGLGKGLSIFDGVKERHKRFITEGRELQKLGITGSPWFAYYEEDFGWGRPEKVEIVSIDRFNGISLMQSRDGSGGIEIGLVLPRHEMEIFASLFSQM